MDHEFDSKRSEAFIEAARSRDLLTDQQAQTLRRESSQSKRMPAALAIESGLLNSVEAEIADAFAAPKDLAPGYEVLDVLGYGALGVVYRARQPRLERDVAIKSIIPSRLVEKNVLARFQQEGAAIGRLQHPNIVAAFDSGSHKHRFYLVMELVRGTDLRMRLERQGPIDVVTALSITRQVASGLAHALAHDIIHRDIKPGNLILTDARAGFDLPAGTPLVKIADFGIARLSTPSDSDEDTRLTIAGSAIGTPMFCAPEQLSGDAVDHRADIYALGATLFNMLTGKPPFKEQKISKLITAKLTGKKYDVESLPQDLPAEVVELIDRMMADDPPNRIDPYERLIKQIDDTLKVIASPRRKVFQRRPPLAVFLVSILALVAAGAGLSYFPKWVADPRPTLQRTLRETPLFNGESVEPWKTIGGLWKSGRDEDNAYVLIGRGAASRTILMPDGGDGVVRSAVAFRVGIDLLNAEAAEVHFAFASDDVERSTRLVVRYSADRLVLGRRDGIDQPLVVLRERGMPPRSREAQGPAYHNFIVELHGEYWFTYLDGEEEPFGFAESDSKASNQTIGLVAIGGEVYFSDIASIAMQAKPKPTAP